MLGSVKADLRPKASAFSTFVSNVLGYLPGPYLYGLACQMDKSELGLEGRSHAGMVMTFAVTWPAFFFICMAYYTKFG